MPVLWRSQCEAIHACEVKAFQRYQNSLILILRTESLYIAPREFGTLLDHRRKRGMLHTKSNPMFLIHRTSQIRSYSGILSAASLQPRCRYPRPRLFSLASSYPFQSTGYPHSPCVPIACFVVRGTTSLSQNKPNSRSAIRCRPQARAGSEAASWEST